ncbi:Ccdc146, partial [Symbiodinium sp. CCMP2592]
SHEGARGARSEEEAPGDQSEAEGVLHHVRGCEERTQQVHDPHPEVRPTSFRDEGEVQDLVQRGRNSAHGERLQGQAACANSTGGAAPPSHPRPTPEREDANHSEGYGSQRA